MNSLNRIEGVRQKIERAKKHVRDLEIAISEFIEAKPYRIGARPHPVAQIHHTTLYVEEVVPVDPVIPMTMGDAIHNLRSALDHLIWQLVEAGGGIPDKDTYFPVIDDGPKARQQYASVVGKGGIPKIAPQASKIIQAAQPYITHDQTLWLIHRLDIVDKHRLLLTVVAAMDKWGVEFATRGTLWFDQNGCAPLVAGNEITNLPTSTYELQAHEDFQLGVDLVFGEKETREPVLYTLKKMVDFVERLVAQLEPYLL